MADSPTYRYLAVDGPIGVGKTTLVDLLARRFEAVRVLEDVNNPFLADFYQDRPGAAFQTQLYFILQRYKQQQEIVQRELFQRTLVSDYCFQKDRIFAYLTLSDDELMLYEKLYTVLEPQVPVPELAPRSCHRQPASAWRRPAPWSKMSCSSGYSFLGCSNVWMQKASALARHAASHAFRHGRQFGGFQNHPVDVHQHQKKHFA